MTAPRTLVFIPTYNERENVRIIYDQIRALELDIDLVFMDDGSPDGTGTILDTLAQTDPRLAVVHRAGKLGIGSAHHNGIRYAYAHGYPVLITMDCDLTHPTSDLPRFIALGEEADVILASRFMKSDSLADWNFVRKTLTKVGHGLTRVILKLPYDATGGFRLYRLDHIDPAIFELTTSTSYSWLFESLYFLWRCGVTVRETPIVLPRRTYGHSKMAMRDMINSFTTLLDLSLRSLRNASTISAMRASSAARARHGATKGG